MSHTTSMLKFVMVGFMVLCATNVVGAPAVTAETPMEDGSFISLWIYDVDGPVSLIPVTITVLRGNLVVANIADFTDSAGHIALYISEEDYNQKGLTYEVVVNDPDYMPFTDPDYPSYQQGGKLTEREVLIELSW